MKYDENSVNIIKYLTYSLLNAFYYNRDNVDMRDLCSETVTRLSNKECKRSHDGDIVYSALVTAFGDYGVSPRIGWFPDGIVSIIIDEINDFIELSLGGE